MKRVVNAILLVTLAGVAGLAASPARADEGLRLPTDLAPHWQARLQLSGLDYGSSADNLGLGTRVLGANLLGDYYLTGSGMQGVRGGLRATGGVWLGPRSQMQGNSGLALGNDGGGNFAIGARSISLLSPSIEVNDPSVTSSYFGIGYTGHGLRSGFSFSADVGLLSGAYQSGNTGLRLDDMAHLMPVLQLGVSYSY